MAKVAAKSAFKRKNQIKCKTCNDSLVNDASIKIGEVGPFCRGCYTLLAIHFNGLELKEVDKFTSDEENTTDENIPEENAGKNKKDE